ncbi:MAG: extracellular solute-binding protein [Caldilineaceae bacterium]|nr:extracellular solute-binding protein [Caldilineaceae bacterium]
MQTNPSRREFLRMTGLGLAGLGLAACAAPAGTPATGTDSGAPSEEAAELVFWHPTQEHGELMQQRFNESGASFQVKWELGEYDTNTKTMAALAAGTPPPVSYLGRWQVGDLAVRNAILTLDDAYEASETLKWDTIWERLQKDSISWGKRWIVPYTTDTRALFYHKDMMEQAGFDPEKPPTTWAEVQEMAVAMTTRDDAGRLETVGFTPSFGNPPVYLMFLTVLWCLGGDMVNEDMSQVTIAGEKGQEAMSFLKQLLDAQGGYEELAAFTKSLTLAEGIDAFSAGQVGLAMNTNGRVLNYDRYSPDLNYGLAVGPVFPDYNIEANYDGGGGWYFFKQGGDFERSWEFVEFLMAPDFYTSYADQFWMMPARSDVGAAWAELDPRREIFISTANTVKWIPIFVGVLETLGDVSTMFDNVLIGGGDIASELDAAQAKIQTILDAHNDYPVPS